MTNRSAHEPGMPVPPILLVVPPQIWTPKGPITPKFEGGDGHPSSEVDGIHLDKTQHRTLGNALAKEVASFEE